MEKKSFEQFKDQVAKENGFSDWIDLIYQSDGKEILQFTNVAAELYADQEKKSYAREAVKADREQIIENSGSIIGCALKGERYSAYILDDNLRNLPIELP